MKLLKFSTTLLVFQLVLCNLAFAQNANSILKKVSEHHQTMADNVDNMELVMRPDGDLGGFDKMIAYYKKVNVDGQSAFKTYTKFEGGMGEFANASSASTQSMDMFARCFQLQQLSSSGTAHVLAFGFGFLVICFGHDWHKCSAVFILYRPFQLQVSGFLWFLCC